MQMVKFRGSMMGLTDNYKIKKFMNLIKIVDLFFLFILTTKKYSIIKRLNQFCSIHY